MPGESLQTYLAAYAVGGCRKCLWFDKVVDVLRCKTRLINIYVHVYLSPGTVFRLALSLLALTDRGARAGFTSHETFKGVANISTVVGWPQYQIAMGSMIQCAALAKNTPGCQMYCYDDNNCVIITSGLEDSSGPQTPGWRCMFYGNADNAPLSGLGYLLG